MFPKRLVLLPLGALDYVLARGWTAMTGAAPRLLLAGSRETMD